jgi:hypothetical protein
MSLMQSKYLGPFAEWVVSPDMKAGDTIYTLTGGALSCTPDAGFEVEVNGILQIRRCLIPDEDRPGQPERTMFFTDACVAEDLSAVTPRHEINWFLARFNKELGVVANHYGKQPSIRWGLVAWVS